MEKITFSLHISSHDYLRYYQGSAAWVNVIADDGRRLKLPANNLRQFLTHSGIQGHFIIEFDDQFKLVSLKRL
ncbi:MAG: DUF2835 domain-containing protein [Desulfuromonas sp.]|nr:DUF2835 domain-containing protein [Desulfuromonas sp.]